MKKKEKYSKKRWLMFGVQNCTIPHMKSYERKLRVTPCWTQDVPNSCSSIQLLGMVKFTVLTFYKSTVDGSYIFNKVIINFTKI